MVREQMSVPGIELVAAQSENHIIGNDLDIPWRVKGEQKLFKEITMGGTLIMGRKTFDSIGRPLPGRETIIVTRNSDYAVDGCTTAGSIEEAIALGKEMGKPIFIAGGGEIYRATLPFADGLHLTTIHTKVEGNITFPTFSADDFELVRETGYDSNINYTYRYYRKKPDITS